MANCECHNQMVIFSGVPRKVWGISRVFPQDRRLSRLSARALRASCGSQDAPDVDRLFPRRKQGDFHHRLVLTLFWPGHNQGFKRIQKIGFSKYQSRPQESHCENDMTIWDKYRMIWARSGMMLARWCPQTSATLVKNDRNLGFMVGVCLSHGMHEPTCNL